MIFVHLYLLSFRQPALYHTFLSVLFRVLPRVSTAILSLSTGPSKRSNVKPSISTFPNVENRRRERGIIHKMAPQHKSVKLFASQIDVHARGSWEGVWGKVEKGLFFVASPGKKEGTTRPLSRSLSSPILCGEQNLKRILRSSDTRTDQPNTWTSRTDTCTAGSDDGDMSEIQVLRCELLQERTAKEAAEKELAQLRSSIESLSTTSPIMAGELEAAPSSAAINYERKLAGLSGMIQSKERDALLSLTSSALTPTSFSVSRPASPVLARPASTRKRVSWSYNAEDSNLVHSLVPKLARDLVLPDYYPRLARDTPRVPDEGADEMIV